MYDDEDNYIILADPDVEPDPEFANMSWPDIRDALDEYEYEARKAEWEYEHWREEFGGF